VQIDAASALIPADPANQPPLPPPCREKRVRIERVVGFWLGWSLWWRDDERFLVAGGKYEDLITCYTI
jgi:hypothetical protein